MPRENDVTLVDELEQQLKIFLERKGSLLRFIPRGLPWRCQLRCKSVTNLKENLSISAGTIIMWDICITLVNLVHRGFIENVNKC